VAGEAAVSAARPGDIAAVAALHATLLPSSFLAELGPRFLEVLYRRILRDDGSFVQVVRDGDRVVAFVAGTESTSRLYRRFATHDLLPAIAAAAPVMLRRSRHVLETLRYGRGAPVPDLPEAELLALAVLPEARGRRLGTRLVSCFQAELARRGTTTARVVVSADNAAAIATYRSCGFETAARIEVHRGHRSEVLRWP
jgi:ribosomal protein S18 acetylase RimI-like enzyme